MAAIDGGGEDLLPGQPYEVSIVVTYYLEERGYEKPKVGDTFTIREAQKIVEFGELLSINVT